LVELSVAPMVASKADLSAVPKVGCLVVPMAECLADSMVAQKVVSMAERRADRKAGL
jgi:hypothetical protein